MRLRSSGRPTGFGRWDAVAGLVARLKTKTRAAVGVAGVLLILAAVPFADGETVQRGNLRIAVEGAISPKALPREGSAPVNVSIGGKVTTTDGSIPPELASLQIKINRHAALDPASLPTCSAASIQPGSTAHALAACRSSLVGQGRFSANSLLAGSPLPTEGRLLLFNALKSGRPELLGHIYSTRPFTYSELIPFKISRVGGGTFGVELSADLAGALGQRIQLTAIKLTLGTAKRPRSFIEAGCPAPKGFPGATFPLARASFTFAGGETLSQTLIRNCKAR